VKNFVLRHMGSIALSFAILLIQAAMMQPGLAALIALPGVVVLLVLLCWIAGVERR